MSATPGPWEIRRRGAAFSSHEIRPAKPLPGAIPLAWVAKLNDGEANARLIAAAPDLLAALQAINRAGTLNDQAVINMMIAAIAKAVTP